MLNLNDLFKKVNQCNPGQPIYLTIALKTWALDDECSEELSLLLAPCGLSLVSFIAVLDGYEDEYNPYERAMLNKALKDGLAGQPIAAAMLWVICEAPHSGLTRALVMAGLDLDCLRSALIGISSRPGVLESVTREADRLLPTLTQYGRNLTELARLGGFDHLFPRQKELEQLVLVLMKTKTSNVVITGPAGAGKTALVELLAKAITSGKVPEALRTAEIYEISLPQLVSGTMYRGQFEARLEALLKELKANPAVIVFMDEMHLLWGAGRTSQSAMDAANILKPYLARGEIRIIGATTTEEYHLYLADDRALERRFEVIPLAPPTGALLLELVRDSGKALSERSGVIIPDESISAAISLSDRWIPQRSQPDKALNLLDLAAAQARVIEQPAVTPTLLRNILGDQTGQPIQELDEGGRDWLTQMEDRISHQLIGQSEAIHTVIQALIYRRYIQEAGTDRNMGIFLFAGSTGVGKTELGRILAQEFYGGKDRLLQIDLAEYTHGSAASRLIGAAPGLVGYEAPGLLANFLHQIGSGVIIFDEIEKAHPDIRNFLLGMLDNGRVRTGKGGLLSTRGCILIGTTNVLKEDDLKPGGFGFADEFKEKTASVLLRQYFSPEFLGRFDELVLFHNLSNEDLRDIIHLRLDEAVTAFKRQGIKVHYEREVLVQTIFQHLEGAGARGVKRAIEQYFSQPVAFQSLSSQNVYWEGV